MIIGFMLIEQYRVDRMHSLIVFIEIIRLRVADERVTTREVDFKLEFYRLQQAEKFSSN